MLARMPAMRSPCYRVPRKVREVTGSVWTVALDKLGSETQGILSSTLERKQEGCMSVTHFLLAFELRAAGPAAAETAARATTASSEPSSSSSGRETVPPTPT